MKNREWLRDMALYDLLMMISENIGGCILEMLGEDMIPIESCNGKCSACLQAWLNDERK